MKDAFRQYRDDEITLILKHCNSIPEMNTVLKKLGWLNYKGVQIIRPVVYKLVKIKEKELFKKLRHGRDNNHTD